MNIAKKNSMNQEKHLKKKKNLRIKGLIQNKKKASSEKVHFIKIFSVCLIFCLHAELSRIMYLFDVNGLDFWIFDIIFTLLFMDTYFKINYYSHKRFSMIFIIIINSILLIISSFLKNTNNKESDYKDKNTYQIIEDITGNNYSFIFIFFIFIFLSCIFSYSRVKSKILMFYNYISPYKIIYYIGIIGSIMTLIAFIFVDIFECKGKEENIKNYCVVTKIDKNNSTKYYYDNIIVYFDEIKNHKYNYKFFFEIIIITPFYLAINFFGFVCEILIIYYLNPIYVLVRENLYYCLQRFVFILVNLDNYNNYTSLTQFIILQISEITALLGYAVYLEIDY